MSGFVDAIRYALTDSGLLSPDEACQWAVDHGTKIADGVVSDLRTAGWRVVMQESVAVPDEDGNLELLWRDVP